MLPCTDESKTHHRLALVNASFFRIQTLMLVIIHILPLFFHANICHKQQLMAIVSCKTRFLGPCQSWRLFRVDFFKKALDEKGDYNYTKVKESQRQRRVVRSNVLRTDTSFFSGSVGDGSVQEVCSTVVRSRLLGAPSIRRWKGKV